jgi:hypothetical protein
MLLTKIPIVIYYGDNIPDGIRGNTHFLMSDLNNVQIADQLSKFLSERSWTDPRLKQ